jgi:hypothetical protein
MPIAELNLARLLHPIDDPRVAMFTDNLDRINAMAERSSGFIWRLKDDDAGNATGIEVTDDPQMIANLSVWDSVAALEKFVFRTVHSRFYARRAAWFEKPAEAHFVMWPVAEGYEPDLAEALERLSRLRAHGDGPDAFGWTARDAMTDGL